MNRLVLLAAVAALAACAQKDAPPQATNEPAQATPAPAAEPAGEPSAVPDATSLAGPHAADARLGASMSGAAQASAIAAAPNISFRIMISTKEPDRRIANGSGCHPVWY